MDFFMDFMVDFMVDFIMDFMVNFMRNPTPASEYALTSSRANLSQCVIYYLPDWFLGQQNRFYSI